MDNEPLFVQGPDLFFMDIQQLDIHAVFTEESTKQAAHSTGTNNCYFHELLHSEMYLTPQPGGQKRMEGKSIPRPHRIKALFELTGYSKQHHSILGRRSSNCKFD